MEWLVKLFDTTDFPRRWDCGNWSEAFGWTYISADLLIASAYFAIPLSIFIYYSRRREEIYFPALYGLFAAFIFFCGVGHFINASLFLATLVPTFRSYQRHHRDCFMGDRGGFDPSPSRSRSITGGSPAQPGAGGADH
jgi:hypothetical protein